MLTTIALLNYSFIEKIFGSDINQDFINIAIKNLSLLSQIGLNTRASEIESHYKKYLKESHLNSLSSLDKFRDIINANENIIEYVVFYNDILKKADDSVHEIKADIIITDVPYDNLVSWSSQDGIDLMLDHVFDQLNEDGVIAIIHNKSQKRKNTKYKRLEKFKVGKRIIEILRKV